MGINNRDRRRQHKRRQAAAERARERRRAETGSMADPRLDADDIERILMRAVCAQRDRDGSGVYDLSEILADSAPGLSGQALVDAVVARCTRRALAAAAEQGWEASVLARVLRRRLWRRHDRVIEVLEHAPGGAYVDELASAMRIDRAWAIQHVVEVLAFVASLPPLPKLRSAERRKGAVDGRILQRVRGLLAKAESTTFPEEAEALTAKAQELMARYAIDRAVVEAAAGHDTDGVSGRRIMIDDPYGRQKYVLLSEVAEANRCVAVWSPDFGWSTVFGADDDLDIVELLFASLLCQATSAMTAAGSTAEGALGRRARTKSFRQSFLVAYAARIGIRLREAAEAATEEAAAMHGSDRLLPVLAARRDAADQAAREAFPHVSDTRISAHDPRGWAAGAAAADVAILDVGRSIEDTAG